MKKTTAILLAALLAIFSGIRTFAAESVITSTAPPELYSAYSQKEGEDIEFSVSFAADVRVYELARTAAYNQLLAENTREEIMASEQAWIAYETKLFCQISVTGRSWFTAKMLEPDAQSAKLSLADDILPVLQKNSIDMSRLVDGFTLYTRLITASENYFDGYEGKIYILTQPSQAKAAQIESFSYIEYEISEEAQNPNPSFFTQAPAEAYPLENPQLYGYTFSGWTDENGKAADKIPANTSYMYLKAGWTPKSYAINYVLATDINFNFGRADNSQNPTRHLFGENTPLYDIKSPIGGYSFCGWYYERDFSGERLSFIPADSAGDVILYAKWMSFEELEAIESAANEAAAAKSGYADIDGDGSVSSADARLILRAAVGLETLTAEQQKRADIFGSGIISSENARTTLRIAVGLDKLSDILSENGIKFG